MSELSIDAGRCSGHGRCYSVAPDLFDMDDVGNGVVLVPDVGPEQEADARRALESCPERAITLA